MNKEDPISRYEASDARGVIQLMNTKRLQKFKSDFVTWLNNSYPNGFSNDKTFQESLKNRVDTGWNERLTHLGF